MNTESTIVRSDEAVAQRRRSIFTGWKQSDEGNDERAVCRTMGQRAAVESYADSGAYQNEMDAGREESWSADETGKAVALLTPQHEFCSETFKVTVPEGLHLRPAAMLVETASLFESDIMIECDGASANAKSIMGLMALNAAFGKTVTISAKGFDAGLALGAIGCLFLSGFAE